MITEIDTAGYDSMDKSGVMKDYSAQKKAGIADPVFHPEQLPDRRGIEAWEEK